MDVELFPSLPGTSSSRRIIAWATILRSKPAVGLTFGPWQHADRSGQFTGPGNESEAIGDTHDLSIRIWRTIPGFERPHELGDEFKRAFWIGSDIR